jgi:hypothetical protein
MTKLVGEKLPRSSMGRPKGSINKTSREAKDAIAEAAEKLGGSNRLVDWAKESPENEKAFWSTIYPKLISVSVSGSLSASLVIKSGVPRAGN